MKQLLIALVLVAAFTGCERSATYLPAPGLREEIVFTYEPSFAPVWTVHLERNSRGEVLGKVFRFASDDYSSRQEQKRFTSTPAAFDELVRLIESEEFRTSAERSPMIGNDGHTYVFSRWMGNRRLLYRIWGADAREPRTRLAVQLSEKFMRAAGISGIEEFQNGPNQ